MQQQSSCLCVTNAETNITSTPLPRTEHTSPHQATSAHTLSCCMHHATPACLVGVCRSKQSVTLAPTSAPSVLTRQRQYCGTCASLTHSLLGTLVTVCATSLLSVVLPCPQPCTAAHRYWHAQRLQRELLREPRTPSLTQRVGSSGFECDTAAMHARPFDHRSPPMPTAATSTTMAAHAHHASLLEQGCAGTSAVAHHLPDPARVCVWWYARDSASQRSVWRCVHLPVLEIVARRRTHERICLLFSVRPSSHSLWLGRR
jgi:hypothetical protein